MKYFEPTHHYHQCDFKELTAHPNSVQSLSVAEHNLRWQVNLRSGSPFPSEKLESLIAGQWQVRNRTF